MGRILFVFIVVLGCWQPLLAQKQQQKRMPIKLITSASDVSVLKKYKQPAPQPDTLAALKEVRTLVRELQRDAYLTASADSFFYHNDTLQVLLYVGPQFEWAQLRSGNLNEGMLIKAGFREKFYYNKPFRPEEFVKLQQKLLEHAENSGFPFAQTWLDSVELQGTQVKAVLMLDTGPLVTYDTILIEGNTRTTTRFLSRYLQITPGQPYNHERVEAANRMLRQLPYLRLTRSPQVRFARDKARLIYYLDDNRSNQIDGIVGVLPNSDNGLAERKLLITGEANVNIRNIKGSGKQVGLQWRKVDRNSQILDAAYLHPNLFGSPLEAGVNFNLFKQDTSFITVIPRIQFSYYTQRYGKISFFAEYRSSRLLSTKGLQNLNTLPPYADITYTSYGINYLWNNLDNFYFPRKGFLGNFQVAIGNKTISRNIGLEPQLYDTIDLRSAQITLSGRTEYYFKLGKNSVLLTR
ncbi:MAG: hypothetical protein LPK19_14760, partial [Hymenobacteraceae bacterium]|nr:hypothetical protein [Hymenobacteraceae bacterium]MDX5397494.1 hypothetical protein [Hymenobacteraceae bacterium]MDX5513570.1 hypothetical protein [Hymenobacteraceae bacterium]